MENIEKTELDAVSNENESGSTLFAVAVKSFLLLGLIGFIGAIVLSALQATKQI